MSPPQNSGAGWCLVLMEGESVWLVMAPAEIHIYTLRNKNLGFATCTRRLKQGVLNLILEVRRRVWVSRSPLC